MKGGIALLVIHGKKSMEKNTLIDYFLTTFFRFPYLYFRFACHTKKRDNIAVISLSKIKFLLIFLLIL